MAKIQVPTFLGFLTAIPFFTVQQKALLPDWGGGLRQSIVGPEQIINRLNRLTSIKVMLIVAIGAILIVLLICVLLLISRMKTDLYVGDGSVFGCHVPLWRPPS